MVCYTRGSAFFTQWRIILTECFDSVSLAVRNTNFKYNVVVVIAAFLAGYHKASLLVRRVVFIQVEQKMMS